VGPDGFIHVADSGNHRVVMLSAEGEYLAEWRIPDADPNIFSPEHIAASPDGSTISRAPQWRWLARSSSLASGVQAVMHGPNSTVPKSFQLGRCSAFLAVLALRIVRKLLTGEGSTGTNPTLSASLLRSAFAVSLLDRVRKAWA
jgi:hypothetical protein